MVNLTSQLDTTDAKQTGVDTSVPFIERISNLILGRREFVNPNAGKFGPKFTPDQEKEMLGTLFGEVSNRESAKQELEAQTILNTMRNRARRKGTDMYKEMIAKNQYQAYKGKQYEKFMSGNIEELDKRKVEAITKVFEQLKAGQMNDNIDGYEYYVHKPDGSISATKDFVGL